MNSNRTLSALALALCLAAGSNLRASLPAESQAFLDKYSSKITKLYVSGGTSSVDDATTQNSQNASEHTVEGDGKGVHTVQQNTDGSTTIAALTGKVTIKDARGKTVMTVNVGTGAVFKRGNRPQTKSLAELVAAEKAANSGQSTLAATLAAAVKSYSDAVAHGSVNGAAAVSELAAIIKVASAADPANAASFVQTAVAGLSQNKSVSGSSDKAITALVAAATAGNSSVDQSAVIAAAGTAARSNNLPAFDQSTFNNNQNNLKSVITPVGNIDVSIVSKSG